MNAQKAVNFALYVICLIGVSPLVVSCQENISELPRLVRYMEEPPQEFVQLTDSIQIGMHPPGYSLVLPEAPLQGLIVAFHPGYDTSHAGYEMRLYTEAVERQLAMLFVTTGNPVEFLFDSTEFQRIDRYIGEAVKEYDLAADRLLCVGMSLAGTRALKFTQWCHAGHSSYDLRPRAVAVCDAPLDFERFWGAGERAQRLGYSEVSANEAAWVNAQLESNLGGTPEDEPIAYQAFSPYYFDLDIAPQCELLRQVAVRAYTEPDVHWWMANRAKSYYGINAVDAAALINDLRLIGNDEAQLITTSGEGRHPDGRRHPHSWSIVDNAELVEWFISLPR